MMRSAIRALVLLFLCGSVFAQDVTVDKKLFASPGPNLNVNRNEFAIIFADEFQNPHHTIFVQLLDAQGRVKGAPVRVSADTGRADCARSVVRCF